MANAYIASASTGVLVALAIAMHNIPEEYAMALPIVTTKSRRFLYTAAFLSGLAEPLGAVIGLLAVLGLSLRVTSTTTARIRRAVEAADAQLRLLLAGTRAEDLRRAEDRLAQAQAELDAATRDRARLEGLAERGTATEKARDDAETRQEVAERPVAAARAELDKLVSGPRSQEVETARAQRAAAEAQVAAINQQITDATVVAPRSVAICASFAACRPRSAPTQSG